MQSDFRIAQEMVLLVAGAGADALKFQIFLPEYLAGNDRAKFERLRGLQFSYNQFAELAESSKSEGIIFFSTPFDPQRAKFLNEIQPILKIASRNNNHWPFLRQITNFGMPMLLSTGMTSLDDVTKMEKVIREVWQKNIVTQGWLYFIVFPAIQPHQSRRT